MKKNKSIAVLLNAPFFLSAQNTGNVNIDSEVFKVSATIFLIALFMMFIIVILKRIMDYRLKNKIVEKGISETVASSILQTNPTEDRNINIKWFCILAGLGAGFTIIYYTLPLGIHSLAIMTFCVSASFLAYYFFLKQSEK